MPEPETTAIPSSLVLASDDPAALAQFDNALLGVEPQPGQQGRHTAAEGEQCGHTSGPRHRQPPKQKETPAAHQHRSAERPQPPERGGIISRSLQTMEHGVHSHGSDRQSRQTLLGGKGAAQRPKDPAAYPAHQGPERQQMVGAAEGMRTRGTLPFILDPLPGPSA
jgi:hypothetical protein